MLDHEAFCSGQTLMMDGKLINPFPTKLPKIGAISRAARYSVVMRFVIGIVVAGLAAAAAAQPQYEFVDLTKQFGEELTAVDINNNGVVVGHMRLNASQDQACTIQNGKLTMLPMYQGIHPWYAIGIGDNGDVLGAGTLGTGTYRSIVYRNGKVIDIGIPGTQENPSSFGINNLGQVTGGLNGTPFIWENGVTTSLPGPPSSFAHAINDSQQLAGLRVEGVNPFATFWDGEMHFDLHPAWAWRSEAEALNNMGEAVGYAYRLTGGQRGVLWRSGKPIDLGDFGGGQSRAYDINDLSQVVGWATNSGGFDEAFFWESGAMHRVEDLIAGGSGFQIVGRAFAVNNSSQLVTIGFGGGPGHYLVLNPVPEPAPFIVMTVGLTILAFSRHRRRG